MKRIIMILVTLSLLCLLLPSCAPRSPYQDTYASQGDTWYMGFGAVEIPLPTDSDNPLYIAGYHGGREIQGVLDLPRANAVWLDTGEGGILMIGIDCVGLGSGTVAEIRNRLEDFCRDTGCVSVNVYATHTHAGLDTLGLWGPAAVDGKNPDYMENLMGAAVRAAEAAYADRSAGTLYYGSATPEDLLHDSREPIEYDPAIHQLRFISNDSTKAGIRLLSYGAHAESLRGANLMLSRDFPGVLSDLLEDTCGDRVLFMPSAIGGLIMTRELTDPFDAEANMTATAERLANTVLSITEEQTLAPSLRYSRVTMELPLDNTFFFFAKFLGILDNEIRSGESDTGYLLQSELGVLTVDSVTLALIPGEIFPELVSGQVLTEEDPEALTSIASRHGAETLLILGLCNDELGYIVPPSNFLINEELPYIETVTDATGENHYEETNSVGKGTAAIIAAALEKALEQMPKP